ncbi:MAG: VOC family protein [Candidatus Obscuribacterales bacterium]|nr:VOC family protein [Candidatus Obscuribacterales bacterium]
MKIKHLDHLNMSVKNFDKTVDWYNRVFGFTLVEYGVRGGVRWGIIKGGESMLCIYEHPEREYADFDDSRLHNFHGINHFGLRITDRNEWEDVIKREKLEVAYGGAVDYPHSTSWYVTDPTGYEIEVALWNKNQINFDGAPMRLSAMF